MGLEECVIILDSITYFPGQKINGIVSFVLNKSKKFDGIKIKVKGEAAVRWSESKSVRGANGKRTTRSVSYIGEESYFNNEWYLAGNESEEMELKPGEYKYPFIFDLPTSLPSSFEGSHGGIRYTIKVTFCRPWKFDIESKVAFTVVSPLDLNHINHVKLPVKKESTKMFGCCCCRSAPLTLTVAIPQTGFVPGQEIPIQIDCENASRVNVQRVKCVIKKVANFHAQTPTRKTKQTVLDVVKIETDPILAHNTLSTLLSLKIPSIPPTGQRNCRVIDLDYELKIAAKPSGLHRDLVIVIPITIGTVPLMNARPATSAVQQATSTNTFNASTSMPSMGFAPPQIGWSSVPSDDYVMNIPPPSYEESQFGTKSIQDESDSKHTKSAPYKPSYPVFPNLPSYSEPK